MKKFIAFMVLGFVLSGSNAFAAAKKQVGENWNTCINKPVTQCAQFGNPWVPNWPAWKCPAGATSPSQCVPNDPQPASFIPFNEDAYEACAFPIIHDCNQRFGMKGI